MPTTTTQLKQTCDWLRNISQEGQLYSDSREITLSENGDAVFFAYPNDEADGRNYIAHAISSGAKAVVHEEVGFEWNKSWGVPHLAVTNLKKHAGQIAASFYRNPDADMFTVAVTGTNGKTSCTQWLAQALSVRSNKTAVIGTLGVGIDRKSVV